MKLSEIPEIVLGKYASNTDAHYSERPSQDEIALLAFSFYEMRGRVDGHDLHDWLIAEEQLRHHYR